MTRTKRKTLAIVGTVTATTAILGGIRLAGPAQAADQTPPANHRYQGGVGVADPPPDATPTDTAPPATTPPVTSPTATPSPTAPPTTPPPTDPTCTATAGDPAGILAPGIGAVTVTITVCDGKVSSVSSILSQSNYGRNRKALLAMDQLAVEYAVADINMVNYSGATLTSDAYRASLRSALVKAGV